jgi:hypothetical protein
MAYGELMVEINLICLKISGQMYCTTQIFQLHSMNFLFVIHFCVHLLIADKKLLYRN